LVHRVCRDVKVFKATLDLQVPVVLMAFRVMSVSLAHRVYKAVKVS